MIAVSVSSCVHLTLHCGAAHANPNDAAPRTAITETWLARRAIAAASERELMAILPYAVLNQTLSIL